MSSRTQRSLSNTWGAVGYLMASCRVTDGDPRPDIGQGQPRPDRRQRPPRLTAANAGPYIPPSPTRTHRHANPNRPDPTDRPRLPDVRRRRLAGRLRALSHWRLRAPRGGGRREGHHGPRLLREG